MHVAQKSSVHKSLEERYTHNHLCTMSHSVAALSFVRFALLNSGCVAHDKRLDMHSSFDSPLHACKKPTRPEKTHRVFSPNTHLKKPTEKPTSY